MGKTPTRNFGFILAVFSVIYPFSSIFAAGSLKIDQNPNYVETAFYFALPSVIDKVETHPSANGNRLNGTNGLGELRAFQPVRVRSQQLIYNFQENIRFGAPSSLFLDRERQEIYVVDTPRRKVAILSTEGFPLFCFGYNGELEAPVSVAVKSNGDIIVVDGSFRKIKIFTFNGHLKRVITDVHHDDRKSDIRFGQMTIGPDGNIYVSNDNLKEILVFDESWNFIRRFGRNGLEGSRFKAITDIFVGNDGTIYVTDAMKTAVQIFDKWGNFVKGWGRHQAGPQEFSLPSGITADDQGRVYVADKLRQDVKIFTPDGRFLGRFGGLGISPGNLAYPQDIVSDGNGRLHVAESGGNRLQIFQTIINGK